MITVNMSNTRENYLSRSGQALQPDMNEATMNYSGYLNTLSSAAVSPVDTLKVKSTGIKEGGMKKFKRMKKMDLITDQMVKTFKTRRTSHFQDTTLNLNLSNVKNLPKELRNLEKFKCQIDNVLKNIEKESETIISPKKTARMRRSQLVYDSQNKYPGETTKYMCKFLNNKSPDEIEMANRYVDDLAGEIEKGFEAISQEETVTENLEKPGKLSPPNLARDTSQQIEPQKDEKLASSPSVEVVTIPESPREVKMMKDESIVRIDAPSIITDDSIMASKKKKKKVKIGLQKDSKISGKDSEICISKDNLKSPFSGNYKNRLMRLLELDEADPHNLGLSDLNIRSSMRGSNINAR